MDTGNSVIVRQHKDSHRERYQYQYNNNEVTLERSDVRMEKKANCQLNAVLGFELVSGRRNSSISLVDNSKSSTAECQSHQ